MREGYKIPDELARHAPGLEFAPEDLRAVCRKAGEGLGREDAAEACFRSAAAMVALWQGLDLPAWEAPCNDVRIGRILWQLLPRLSVPERFRILREAIKEGRALHTITSEVAVMGQQHGKLGAQARSEAERIVNAKHLAELEELAVNRIREAARRPFNEPDSLLQLPQLEHSLYRWHDWGNESEIRNWFISMENEGLTDADLTKQQREDIQRFSENL